MIHSMLPYYNCMTKPFEDFFKTEYIEAAAVVWFDVVYVVCRGVVVTRVGRYTVLD